MPDYIPVRVDAYPSTPIIADPYLPLDGLLTALVADHESGWLGVTEPGRTPRGNWRPPLRKIHGNGWWFYACSFAVWPDVVAVGAANWAKRFDSAETSMLDRGREKINISAGRYRPMHIPVRYRHAVVVTWYAVGDPEELRNLLRRAYYIGKKGSQGYGFINKWKVTTVEQDWSVRFPGGELTRAIPADIALPDDARGHYGLHPPYWRPDHQQLVGLPRR